MLENLLNLVTEYAQDNVVDNPDIPNEQNNEVVAEATHAVAGGLQDALANGHTEDVLALFNSKSAAQAMSSPVAQQIQGGFLDNITSKLGINKNVAIGLASTLIPIVISKLVKRSNDPNNSSFDIGGIVSSLTGGSNAGGSGIGNLISQFTSGGNNSSGGIESLINQFTGGAQQQQKHQGGSGLMDLIKGFIK
ncbi:MAG: hypothetical protein V4722_26510 [Bacteroidota bacterium]